MNHAVIVTHGPTDFVIFGPFHSYGAAETWRNVYMKKMAAHVRADIVGLADPWNFAHFATPRLEAGTNDNGRA